MRGTTFLRFGAAVRCKVDDMLIRGGAGMSLTAVEAARLAGVAESTWRAYVARGQAPAPTAWDPSTGRRVWDTAEVQSWLSSRPGAGARTDRPDPKSVVRRGRYGVRSRQSSDGVEVHTVTVPRSGPGREKGRGALLVVLERAVERGARVAFRVWVKGHDEPVALGGKGGYEPARVLADVRGALGDPFEWLASQLVGRLGRDPAAGALDRVDVRFG